MANNNASAGLLVMKVGVDHSGVPSGLAKTEAMTKASRTRTAEASAAIDRKAKERAEKAAPRMTAGKGAEAANKLATAGGISGLGPIAALGSLGPAALGAGIALGALGGMASLASSAFEKFEKDLSLNATNATAAGEAIRDFKDGLGEAATELTGNFLNALTGGAMEERRAEQQRGRDLDRQNAEMFKKNKARQDAEAARIAGQKEVFERITGGFKSMMLMREASQMRMRAEQLEKEQTVEFDPAPIAAMIATTTAQMATYGTESALEIMDAKSLAEEQKQSRLLAEIAKKSTPQVFVLEF